MRRADLVFLFTSLAFACDSKHYRECSTSDDCVQAGVPGTCRPSPTSTKKWCSYPDSSCPSPPAERWGVLAGDGLAETCVVQEAVDAGIVDAPVVDAGGEDAPIDAMPDAMPDASPDADICSTTPPITNGQPATLVLGQPDFVSNMANNGGLGDDSLNRPSSVVVAGTKLWVHDAQNGRVLQWDTLPIVDGQAANHVLGQLSMFATQTGPSDRLLTPISGGPRVYSDGTRVYVSDPISNRVLIWNMAATENGPPAAVVLGQTAFDASAAGKGASNFDVPLGLWADAEHLIVADYDNSRVLIWNSIPTTNGAPADVVLGWPDFGLGNGDTVVFPPIADSLNHPNDVYSDGARLFVADTANNRVLIWNEIPTVNGTPADVVVGQSGFTNYQSNAGGAGPNSAGLFLPRGITGNRCSLFVADTDNHRVVVYTPVPTANGTPATAVLGQPTLISGTDPAAPTAEAIKYPAGMTVRFDKLFVADTFWHRVLRYDLSL